MSAVSDTLEFDDLAHGASVKDYGATLLYNPDGIGRLVFVDVDSSDEPDVIVALAKQFPVGERMVIERCDLDQTLRFALDLLDAHHRAHVGGDCRSEDLRQAHVLLARVVELQTPEDGS